MGRLLFWPALVLVLSLMQGLLMPAIRRTPSGTPEAKRQANALHGWGTLAYFLPLLLCPAAVPFWFWLATAVLTRLALFDVPLNLAAGDKPFAVGQTAFFDQVLRTLAPGRPDMLNALIKAGALLALGIGFVYLNRR